MSDPEEEIPKIESIKSDKGEKNTDADKIATGNSISSESGYQSTDSEENKVETKDVSFHITSNVAPHAPITLDRLASRFVF